MTEKGKLTTCDRCGKTVFSKTIGDGETDGGYTRWNKFEEPKGWSFEYKIGDLCPECTEKYKELVKDFEESQKKFLAKDGES